MLSIGVKCTLTPADVSSWFIKNDFFKTDIAFKNKFMASKEERWRE